MRPDKLALVTGGSGALGAGICRRLAADGYLVCVHYNSRAVAASDTVNEINAKGGEAFACAADLRRDEDVRALFSRLAERRLPIGALINNAGTLVARPLRFLSVEDFVSSLEVNAIGSFRCLKHAAEEMTRAGAGTIVNVLSLSCSRPLPGQIAYTSGKSALLGMTLSAAIELAAYGVTVNAIEPGLIEGAETFAEQYRQPDVAPPLGRYPTVEDIAECVAFLCSSHARRISGQVIRLDSALSLTTWATQNRKSR